jgi:hypothetical protein
MRGDGRHTGEGRVRLRLLVASNYHLQLGARVLRLTFLLTFLVFSSTSSMLAQQASPQTLSKAPSGPIQDNSFLVEEAYNQEDGVIQHINFFQKNLPTRDWIYTLTDEWPVRSYKHQLSFTLAGAHAGDFGGSGAGWGDTAVNYRYQLVGNGEAKVAFAPRATVLLPTGDSRLGRGTGGVGYQIGLPISIMHSEHWQTNWNAGATWVPHARNERGEMAGITSVNLGQSVVWLATERVNLMMETVWTTTESVQSQGKTAWSQNLFISPGIRWSYNFANGLQIVPGVAMPIGIGPNAGEKGVLLYLSFEHPFAFAHSRPH